MDIDERDPSFQDPRELAGPYYTDMMQSQESTLRYLSSGDPGIRIAAVLACVSNWGCGSHSEVVRACIEIAGSEVGERFRACAAGLLGTVLSSTRDTNASRFLANLVLDSMSSSAIQSAAYWALREIQYGPADVNFDTFVKRLICTSLKPFLREYPEQLSEADARRTFAPVPGFPKDFWDLADEVDWEFVRSFTS